MERKSSGDGMRIVMVVTNPFKPDPRVYKEAKSLAKYGHDVYVIAWDREGKYPKEEKVEGFKVIRVGPKAEYGPLMAVKLPLFYLNAFKIILKLKPDAIHTHDFDTAVLGFIFKKLKKTMWVYDVHDLYFTFFSMEGRRNIIGEIIRKLDLLIAKHPDVLIVATQSIGGKYKGVREYYIKHGIFPEKTITIWNVPDADIFLNYSKLVLKKSKKFTIGFIGGQRTISNFIPLFEAVKDKSHIYKILFVGEGKNTGDLKMLVREKYSELDIEFIGNVDYRLIPNYYKLCDVIFAWYPPRENIERAIAIKVFEAAVMGIPSIVNANTLMEDFVEEYRCGVAIKKLKSDYLKQALDLIRSRKLKFNPAKIAKKWNWKNEERKMVIIYAQSPDTN
ncbi:glycosyltransferase [Thermococcus sp. SY098]|uniref:glycosyltransferase n=1 Tax=Thermococcus sp. SY098 TaxID=3111325 RepID=UPI002D77DC98|nr:glycosyltransferase [Thermococcus sp. SY098]WRS51980.1 glycosyltransferase [Thermococcus sp. SY098]